jgi:hypothetical protein
MDKNVKDIWDKLKIVSEIVIAGALLLSSIYFSINSGSIQSAGLKVSESNTELAKSEIKRALIPLLTDEDPKQRKIALSLTQSLDPSFAVTVANIMTGSDPYKGVRVAAKSALRSLAKSNDIKIKKMADSIIADVKGKSNVTAFPTQERYDVLYSLFIARSGLDMSNTSDQITAVNLYRKALSGFSKSERAKLNQEDIKKADLAYIQHNYEEAVKIYDDLFKKYR